MKKFLMIILVLLYCIKTVALTYAYTTDDWFNIYYQGDVDWADIYDVPPGKDLIINFLYADSTVVWELYFRDDWIDIAWWNFVENKNYVFLVFKDKLQLRDWSSQNNYTITGLLVDEDFDISNIINWMPEKKQHFTKDQIATILQFEVSLCYLWGVFVFYSRLTKYK